jgi:hypothetical protein
VLTVGEGGFRTTGLGFSGECTATRLRVFQLSNLCVALRLDLQLTRRSMPFQFPVPDLLRSPSTRTPTAQTHSRSPDFLEAEFGPVPVNLVPLEHPSFDLSTFADDLLALVSGICADRGLGAGRARFRFTRLLLARARGLLGLFSGKVFERVCTDRIGYESWGKWFGKPGVVL